MGIGVQRKAMDAGTACPDERWHLALVAKAGANAPHLLPRAFAKGDALLHRGRHGTGEFRCVVPQGVIACRHNGVEARFQVPELPQCAEDTPADLLDHRCNVGIGEWLALDKTRPQALGRAVYIDAFIDVEL